MDPLHAVLKMRADAAVAHSGASFHPRQIPPFLTFCWGVAGRTFLREIAIRQMRGVYDSEEVQRWRQSVQGIVARLEQTRTPVGRVSTSSPLATLAY